MCSLHELEQFFKKNIFRQGKIRFSKGKIKSCNNAGYLDNPYGWPHTLTVMDTAHQGHTLQGTMSSSDKGVAVAWG